VLNDGWTRPMVLSISALSALVLIGQELL
jgi:hypothetical protein